MGHTNTSLKLAASTRVGAVGLSCPPWAKYLIPLNAVAHDGYTEMYEYIRRPSHKKLSAFGKCAHLRRFSWKTLEDILEDVHTYGVFAWKTQIL